MSEPTSDDRSDPDRYDVLRYSDETHHSVPAGAGQQTIATHGSEASKRRRVAVAAGIVVFIIVVIAGNWADEISTLYRARWVVELLFRELKSRYSLGEFETEKAHIVKIQVVAALLTLVVSRAILREFVEYAEEQGDECVFPPERWAVTFRSLAQLILQEIAAGYGYPRPNLGEILYHEAKQPSPSRLILPEEVNAELCGGFSS